MKNDRPINSLEIKSYFNLSNSIFNFLKIEAYTVKVTLDAELNIDQDISQSIIDKISKSLKIRKRIKMRSNLSSWKNGTIARRSISELIERICVNFDTKTL